MKTPIDSAAFTPFIASLFKLWVRTIRFEPVGESERLLDANRQGSPTVLALWHGEIFPVAAYGLTMSSHLVTFVSQSRDGEFIAQVLERLGHTTVRGSSSRGGVKALLQAKRVMERENRMAVFTIDGPKGPLHKAKDGVIFLAQRVGAKIIPLRAYPKRKKIFDKSWDHFVLPMPFTRCPIYIGEPMEVTSEKLTKEVLAQEAARLEARMLSLGPE
ncbi:lysophospholipid acyltransferase family protein [Pseudodesulfovibrio thermohalotolerans]|uniref:lysophospholipid acyltransferase family protein n=1 Tax=Pseudodesulfovibrio thermohalotolerans TaxID=2880651 RepID=UPI0024436BB0|nr:lysophospholipid acyltransferase family protein [Pseudodesulfovibrio thermohalotolerans]WFS60890.1 lysophospholipid acyltransferase family protein [Pseudodesulfovibrio thermohalotolerans]